MSADPLARLSRVTLGQCARAALAVLRFLGLSLWPVGLIGAGVLALVPGLPCQLESGMTALRLHALAQRVELSVVRTGALPGSVEALHTALGEEAWPVDAWGRPVHVLSTADALALVSLGADGEPGGEGADADLTEVVRRPAAGASPAPASPAPRPR